MATYLQLNSVIAAVERTAGPDPLARLAVAREAAGELAEVADHLVGHFVDEARRGGASWTVIGDRMGVTKQAARKRFLPADLRVLFGVSRGTSVPAPPFDRFTERARRTVKIAQENARTAGEAAIGTEHLLLGVCAENGGLGAKVIEDCGVRLSAVRAAVNSLGRTEAGVSGARLDGHLPPTPATGKALELAARAALQLGHEWIGTEHLLLGMLAEPSGDGGDVLRRLGMTPETAEDAVCRRLASGSRHR